MRRPRRISSVEVLPEPSKGQPTRGFGLLARKRKVQITRPEVPHRVQRLCHRLVLAMARGGTYFCVFKVYL